ncbi:MAG: ATP-binding protein, partial [Bacteroidaceae bacterium]|nr:ATP-binding protein [Bacteroidaceae bacterium]
MFELELQQYLLHEYPQENARCEWKEFKNLKNSFCGDEKDDVISYVSAIANMEGGFLLIGVHDKTLEIVGRGIRKIFNQQWERRFPMPDYEIDAAKKEVAVRLYGNAINEKYTKLLKENKDLSFEDCLLLDAVQKGHQLNDVDAQNLLSRGLIEVQDDQYYISLDVARKTKQVPEYTKSKGLEKQKLIQMILQYLKNAGEEGSKRDGIYEYLKDVLPQN